MTWWQRTLIGILIYEAAKIWCLLDATAAFSGFTDEAEAAPIAQVQCSTTMCPLPKLEPGTTKLLPGPVAGWYTVNADGSVTWCRLVARI